MGFFSFLFGGKYPSTKKYEAKCLQHVADFEKFKTIATSSEMARYIELKEITSSADFKARVTKLKTEKFSSTEACKKEQEYKRLASSQDIKDYLKFSSKGLDSKLQNCLESGNYKDSIELKGVVNSPEFRAKQASKDFKKSEEYQTLKRFKRALKSSEVKFVNKTTSSTIYRNYTAIKGSDKLAKYEELKTYVNSNEFKSYKAEIEDKKRFAKSPEANQIAEYERLCKNKNILWYNKCLAQDSFADLKKWHLTFEDDFNGNSFDKNKWSFGYYQGQTLAKASYSLESEKQTFKEGNITALNSQLSISTRPEKAKGNVWSNTLGFVEGEFDFTSGIINTGNAFKQKYGRFDFKVKADFSKPLTHNIWLSTGKAEPQINVMNYGLTNAKSFLAGVALNGKYTSGTISGANFSSDFYIISILWTPEKIVWSVNGVEVYTYKGSIPQEEMYIVLSSNLKDNAPKLSHSTMSLDWIRVYTWQA